MIEWIAAMFLAALYGAAILAGISMSIYITVLFLRAAKRAARRP